jgi:FkbM family methyltransferase
VRIINGWHVPDSDVSGFRYILRESLALPQVLRHCKDFRTCVQAGGNIGIYPKLLARDFDRVITFEPHAENYQALCMNTKDIGKISRFQMGLGKEVKRAGMHQNLKGNMGAIRVSDGDDISIVDLDSLFLNDVDLIYLDIEGYELFALQGAEKTIEKTRPVITVELNGLAEKFGSTDQAVRDWLTKRSYKQVTRVGHDYVYVSI